MGALAGATVVPCHSGPGLTPHESMFSILRYKFVPEQRLQSKKQQVQKWQRYTEPGDELEPTASSPMKRSSRNLSDDLDNGDEDDCPLPEAVLTTNLGLDIVVVATKVNNGALGERNFSFVHGYAWYLS